MRTLTTLTLGILLTTVGISIPLLATADPSSHHMGYGGMHEGRMMHDGSMGGYGPGHGSGHSWKTSLTDEQRKKVDKLRLAYKQEKYLLKAKLKQAKVEFALLITEDKPSKSSIDKKIDQIIKLKKEKLRLKADHKINVRKQLSEDQRVQFDLAVLKKMSKGKHRKGRH